ncbi:MAG: nuclear transport factor 2 family protein [Leptolyngbya sp. SIO4C5]|uniref:nuclear transport factor 2 family protein n=1 Tax=Sphaerothrix gracilis TaxID=3151835 RepID=UPI0013BEE39E|nr:nuclear transport factor 2 family protein [Leptolyngbya sp. SIO4C5]
MTNERESVLIANDAFYRAFEKKNLEAMEAVWSQGIGSLCIHPGRDALKGWMSIRDTWEQIFKHTHYIEVDTEIISVEVSGDFAYVVLIENVLQISSGRRIEAQSMATNIFERMADRWYMVHHHGSPLVK